jgi:DNA-directed RNA polymerase specialized sigma24 family protein
VLARMYPRWRRIRGDPEAYARAALANAAANRWRRRARRVAEAPLEAAAQPGVAGPEQQVAERDSVIRALGELPARMRAVLVLRSRRSARKGDWDGYRRTRPRDA